MDGGARSQQELSAVGRRGSKGMRKIIPQEHYDRMAEYYLAGMTSKQSAAMLGYGEPRCLEALAQKGIPHRPIGYKTRRTHSCHESFFHVIDTEEKAYWLGFLAADGCITTGHRVVLDLAVKDKNHLYKLKHALQAEQNVSANQEHASCSFTIRSAQMVEDLAKHGVHPRKTHTTFAPELASFLQSHYWRGVFDGDGCIFLANKSLCLVGNFQILSGFRDFCATVYPTLRSTVRSKETIFQYSMKGEGALSVLDAMYAHATVSLDRKFEIYQQLRKA